MTPSARFESARSDGNDRHECAPTCFRESLFASPQRGEIVCVCVCVCVGLCFTLETGIARLPLGEGGGGVDVPALEEYDNSARTDLQTRVN